MSRTKRDDNLLTQQNDADSGQFPGDSIDRELDLLQTVWGAGFLQPGGRDAVMSLLESCDIGRSTRLLDLAAGIGGAAQYLGDAFGASVTAFERDYQLVGYGNRRDDGAALQHYDPESVELTARRYDIVFAQHLTCGLYEKERLLREVHRALKSSGVFVFTDLVLPEGRNLRDLRAASPDFSPPGKASPWRKSQYADCLRNAGFTLTRTYDESVEFRSDIIEAWQQVTERGQTGQYTRAQLLALVERASTWLETIGLIQAGHLDVVRFEAVAI